MDFGRDSSSIKIEKSLALFAVKCVLGLLFPKLGFLYNPNLSYNVDQVEQRKTMF